MARRLLCDGLFRIWSHDAHTGRPLDHGRRHRTITPAQRRHLLQRDHGCAVPGCSNTRFVDAHHIIHWLYGGRTDLDNLVMLCTHHHDEVHDGRLIVRALGGQHFTFHTHTGRLIEPAPQSPDAEANRDLEDAIAAFHAGLPPVNGNTLGQGWYGDHLNLDLTVSGLLQRRQQPA